jgi:hypothetical protein
MSKDEAEKQIDRFAGSLDTGTGDDMSGSRSTIERKKN